MSALPYAVMIHSVEQGRTALAPGLPVTLLSGPGAALYAGVPWWCALMAELRARNPARTFPDLLDCADAPGFAAQALRLGQKGLIFAAAEPRLAAHIAALAAEAGAVLLALPPPALDLAQRGAERRLAAWLSGEG
jgi:hypothetical protein